jgi:hypothetical protein
MFLAVFRVKNGAFRVFYGQIWCFCGKKWCFMGNFSVLLIKFEFKL